MPIITPVQYDLSLPVSHGNGRSNGIHVSNIVRAVALKMGYLAPQYASDDKPDADKMELGTAWEDRVFPVHHPDIVYHIGEMSKDEVVGTVDGIKWFDKGTHRVSECKLTWKSMKKALNLQDEWMWLAQTMSYCNMWETNLARYHIFWAMGNYTYGTPEGRPQYRMYDLEFSAKELRENWNMILNAKHLAKVETY